MPIFVFWIGPGCLLLFCANLVLIPESISVESISNYIRLNLIFYSLLVMTSIEDMCSMSVLGCYMNSCSVARPSVFSLCSTVYYSSNINQIYLSIYFSFFYYFFSPLRSKLCSFHATLSIKVLVLVPIVNHSREPAGEWWLLKTGDIAPNIYGSSTQRMEQLSKCKDRMLNPLNMWKISWRIWTGGIMLVGLSIHW